MEDTKMTNEMIDRIKAIAEEHELDYEVIAVRVQDVPVGESIDHVSHIWDDGNDTGEELDGICGTRVSALDMVSGEYLGNYVAVIGGNSYEYGEDIGEVIIRDAKVIEIIA